MNRPMISPFDENVRGQLTRMIAGLGHAPSNSALAEALGARLDDVEAALRRLHDAHALLLHPHTCRPWAVHPFALSPASCWVDTETRGYWANCLYCAFGIAAATAQDATITTRFGGEADTARFRIAGGELVDARGVFHLPTPVTRWWENVIHTCATFQPFPDASQIDPWCERHAIDRGAVLSVAALWAFARDWYGGYLLDPWHKRSADEIRAIFDRHGLTGEFWRV